MNKDQGQRGGNGRTEEVNRAEDDSNPFDRLPNELLKMITEHSPSGLSTLHNVCSRFRRIVGATPAFLLPRLHLEGNICPRYNSVMSLIREYNKGISVVMELKDIISSKKGTQA